MNSVSVPRVLRHVLAPVLLASLCCIAVLFGIYAQPFNAARDAHSWTVSGAGLFDPEGNQSLSYVYTRGDALLHLPQAGIGRFILQLRLAGPGGAVPVAAHLGSETQQVDLRTVKQLRVYHLYAAANGEGDLPLRLQSGTTQINPDPRHLGLLLQHVGARSLGPAMPPTSLAASTPIILLLAWLAIAQLPAPLPRKLLCLILASAALCVTYAVFRGSIAIQPWWLGLGLAAVAAMGLSRSERQPFLTSAPGIACVFVLWRVALWVAGGIGLWYSDIAYRYGRTLAFSFGKTIFTHEALLWRTLAASWMQWDSENYQAIALKGYTFLGQVWPTIAFFPLYPLLIRTFLPLAGHNVAVVALLISNLALLAAVLLLYDLLATDFDRTVAYRSIVLLLLFPTSFYFVAGYTESLALALAVAAVWAMRRQRWWLAGAAGGFLALTRVPGVMITPILAIAYLRHHRWRWRSIRVPFLAVLLPPLGLGLFMLYQWWRFDTPFAFLIAQQSWNNGAAPPWVIPSKILNAIRHSSEWEMAVLQLAVWITFIILTVLALRRLPLVYGLTGLLLLLPAYLANQRGSLLRHVLIGFSAFVILAMVADRPWLRWLVMTAMLPLLVILTMLFVNGFGIA